MSHHPHIRSRADASTESAVSDSTTSESESANKRHRIDMQTAAGASSSASAAASAVIIAASLLGLPPPLLQTVMHALDPKDRLSLSRCARWTLRCADVAFAWRDCPPLRIKFGSDPPATPPSLAQRRVPIAWEWLPRRALTPASFESLLEWAAAVRLIHFHCRAPEFADQQLMQLLGHPSFQQLESLILTRVKPEMMPLVSKLSFLHTLDLRMHMPWSADSAYLSLLDLPDLTSLSVVDGFWSMNACAPQLSRFTRLRSLSIKNPAMDAAMFVPFCKGLSGLQELTFEAWTESAVKALPSSELAAGFSALLSLRVLRLPWCEHLDNVFEHLSLAPSLRRLCISFSRFADESLMKLMHAAPHLELELGDSSCAAVQDQFPSRVRRRAEADH